MAKSSNRGYLEPVDASSFNDGEPVSARRAYVLANNLNHLVDESAQHRINWVADASATRAAHNGTNGTAAWWVQPFPWTSVVSGKPTNLDIFVRVSNSDATITGTYRVRVVDNASKVGSEGATTYYDSGFQTVATTTAITTIAATQVFMTITSFPGYPNLNSKWESTENGITYFPKVHMARLEVSALSSSADHTADVVGVTVREFV